jgi:hypothetical protein
VGQPGADRGRRDRRGEQQGVSFFFGFQFGAVGVFSLSFRERRIKKTHFFSLLSFIHRKLSKSHPGWVIPFLGLTSIFATLSMIAANYSVGYFFFYFSQNKEGENSKNSKT